MDDLFSLVVGTPGFLVCQKVKFGPGNPHDPNDTSNEWFKIIVHDGSQYPIGTLVRFSVRHSIQEILFGELVYTIESKYISYFIPVENVKESLFR